MNLENYFKLKVDSHVNTVQSLKNLIPNFISFAKLANDSIRNGGKLIFIGNGGSAADAQHLAAELIGRYKKERDAIPAIALTTDTSIITAVSNDYEFDNIFVRQLQGLASEKDLVICISTSGNSNNIHNAITYLNKNNINSFLLAGKDGGECLKISKNHMVVDSFDTAHIQECHIFIGHLLCECLEVESLEL